MASALLPDGIHSRHFMTQLETLLTEWPLTGPVSLRPVKHSENRVFHVTDAAGGAYILRLHRAGYHDEAAIRSELNWITALARETPVLVPEIVLTRSGDVLAPVSLAGYGKPSVAVLFVEQPGELPDQDDPRLPEIFAALGEAAALCHTQALGWEPREGFTRPSWTISNMIGQHGLWGDWRAEPSLNATDTAILSEAQARLERQFAGYGASGDRFALIHNDMRPSNFLWHEDRLRLIDFDDCGFGWLIADFAASVSWFEDDPRVPELFRRWRDGYTRHRPLDSDDLAMAGAAVLARRLLLMAWGVTRADTELAVEHSSDFSRRTLALAQRFLDGDLLV